MNMCTLKTITIFKANGIFIVIESFPLSPLFYLYLVRTFTLRATLRKMEVHSTWSYHLQTMLCSMSHKHPFCMANTSHRLSITFYLLPLHFAF